MTVVAIIGAGPAGLAAAEAALACGADTVLIDLNDKPGGQYNRELPNAYHAAHPERVHHDWEAFATRRDTVLSHPHCHWWANSFVFLLEHRPESVPRLHVITGPIDGSDRPRQTLEPDALILATGAHDRVVPFPGWTLPGVFTAGAAQTLASTERVAIARRAAISGTGPFLLPVGRSLAGAGTRVVGVLEANTLATLARGWLSRPHRLVAQRNKLAEVSDYATSMLCQRIPFHTGHAVVRALGDTHVEAAVIAHLDAKWSPLPGTERTVAVDAIVVGHGFTPSLELAYAAGCHTHMTFGGTFVAVDDTQQTSVPGVYAAGEITGIGGAQTAAVEGAIAGVAATGHRERISRRLFTKRSAAQHFVARLAAAHPIRDGWHDWLTGDTTICRCEGTTLEHLRAQHSTEKSLALNQTQHKSWAGALPGAVLPY